VCDVNINQLKRYSFSKQNALYNFLPTAQEKDLQPEPDENDQGEGQRDAERHPRGERDWRLCDSELFQLPVESRCRNYRSKYKEDSH